MPVETLIVLAATFAIFGVFGMALAYVNAIAGARAITAQEEAALRPAARSELDTAPHKLAA